MSELRELYQEVILDHNRSPHNFGRLPDASSHADGYNPLCGDQVTVFIRECDGIVEDISFEGKGCAISQASASIMTDSVKGKTVAEIFELFETFHGVVTGADCGPTDELTEIAALSGVREFPIRVKCATLPWHTLLSALPGGQAVAR
jgi:nitrogen fixation NifU-like protein